MELAMSSSVSSSWFKGQGRSQSLILFPVNSFLQRLRTIPSKIGVPLTKSSFLIILHLFLLKMFLYGVPGSLSWLSLGL